MKKVALSIAALVAALAFQSCAGSARAQNPDGGQYRSWVTATGNDANTSSGCEPTAPCRTFQAALSVTEVGGEVNCLGPTEPDTQPLLTITGTVTIDCHGTFAGIRTGAISATSAVVVNASGAVVTLRGLNLSGDKGAVGLTDSVDGILIEAAALVNIEDCVVENFLQNGIGDQRSESGQLIIRNTVLRNNGSSSVPLSAGLNIKPASGVKTKVSIDHSQISGNYFGIVADGTGDGIIHGVVKDSVVSGNSSNGITAHTSGSSVWLVADNTSVSGNLYGLVAGGSGASLLARNTTVVDNTTGLFTNNSGVLVTYGNNSVAGNTTNGAFTATVAQQ